MQRGSPVPPGNNNNTTSPTLLFANCSEVAPGNIKGAVTSCGGCANCSRQWLLLACLPDEKLRQGVLVRHLTRTRGACITCKVEATAVEYQDCLQLHWTRFSTGVRAASCVGCYPRLLGCQGGVRTCTSASTVGIGCSQPISREVDF